MAERILLSSAYFPPVHYIALIAAAQKVFIEKEENYIKQTYRNRCDIISSNGPISLAVPVLLGSFHKTRIKESFIDYSKRWQNIHLRTLITSYKSSPYFEYYFDLIEKVILKNHKYLLDLNMHSLHTVLEILKIERPVYYTEHFEAPEERDHDFRYEITPKKKIKEGVFLFENYTQVFDNKWGFKKMLSILDLIFNLGPDCPAYLKNILI